MRQDKQARVFQLVGGHPALDLVNTLDWRFREEGTEELLTSYGDVVSFAEQSELLTSAEARRVERGAGTEKDRTVTLTAVRALREALAEVLYAQIDGRKPAEMAVRTLERFFKTAQASRTLRWNGDGMQWEWPSTGTDQDLALLKLVQSAEELVTGEKLAMLRDCAKPDCRWLFLDTSKNHTRRWCDMKICGNRMKARRFKALHAVE